jgi:putative peptidoglycan lipid II flippase
MNKKSLFQKFLSLWIVKNGKKLLHRPQTTILSAAAILALTYLTSAILGIFRNRVLYAHFFSCCVSDLDAYNAAFRLPDTIFSLLVTGSLSASFIPVFSKYFHQSRQESYRFASSVVNILFLTFLSISTLIIIFALPLSRLLAPGFDSGQVALMAHLTQFMMLAQIFFLLSTFTTGILQTRKRFLIPALAPIVYNLAIILAIIFLSSTFGIYAPAFGVVVGAAFHFLIQLPLLLKLGFKYFPIFSFRLSGVKEVIQLMLPRSLSLGLGELENTFAMVLATSFVSGSLSIFNLSEQLMRLPTRLFGVAIGQAALPTLSKAVAKKDYENFLKLLTKTLLQTLFISLPLVILLLTLRLPIVRLAFGAKQFPWKATLLTANILAYFVPAIITQTPTQILIRAFYALHDTKTPFFVSAFAFLFNIAFSLFFSLYLGWGILGLTAGISLASIIHFSLLIYLMVKRFPHPLWSEGFLVSIKMILCSLLTLLFSWSLMRLLDVYILNTTKTLFLLILSSIVTLLGLSSYLLLSRLFSVSVLFDFLSLLPFRKKR